MAQILILGLFFPGSARGARAVRWLAPLLFAAVVALQHRSVWIATLVGIASALGASRSALESRLRQFAALVLVITLAALPLAFSERLSGLTGEIGHSAATALAGQRTVHSRLQDWRQTIREWSQAGPKVVVMGYGFGRDTTRSITTDLGERRSVQFSAHNHYVALLTELGILGLGLFLLLVAPAMVALYRSCATSGDGVLAPALLTLMTMQLAYYVPYGTNYLQHALLGVALAFLATAARRTAAPDGAARTGHGGLQSGNAA
jgi:O-antigen ligase